MKIKFLEAGYEKFTGYFGTVHFTDGVSTGDVSDAEARLFASITAIEPIGGEIVGDNERYTRSYELSAVSSNCPTLAELNAASAPQTSESGAAPATISADLPAKFTLAELETIADAGGIAGLREIADKLDIKGTSISKLIESILAAQVTSNVVAPVEAQTEALVEVPAVVVVADESTEVQA